MSEIEKMYENANIKAKEYCDRDSDACMSCCPEWENRQDCWKYKSVIPPFTAEKLIKLEMFLINKGDFDIKKGSVDITFESFTSCIAGLINTLWQSLTSEEKQQVKGILE